MNLPLPDKWIRKAIYDSINNIEVDGYTIPCYDYRATNNAPEYYVLVTTQSNEVDRSNKCGYRWDSSVLLEITTRYDGSGNTGSRLLSENITDEVRDLVEDLTLDIASGLNIMQVDMSFPNDLATITTNENVFRKFIRLEITIN